MKMKSQKSKISRHNFSLFETTDKWVSKKSFEKDLVNAKKCKKNIFY